MSLKERLNSDLRDAMRGGDTTRRSALRMALSAVRNAEIEKRSELDDPGVQQVLAKEVKQRRESIAEFEKGGRKDLVDQEQAEIDALAGYLPVQLDEREVEEIARAVITEIGAAGPGDKGKVMSPLIKKLAGRADGRLANEVVTRLLSS
ncbi:MAG: GatB/YqeY domain-containing protein [Dehalococcoidia bacterium]